ncbi:hypothetical protein C8R43DRAFT_1121997 [Mycena crocata]|nr:hypothetical protein C8R43DRAFT_1121991 [Mycena crocata]KAJ7166434.1 hypothetical protein C8R43DRAFT_1121997 [Mycena crocata]
MTIPDQTITHSDMCDLTGITLSLAPLPCVVTAAHCDPRLRLDATCPRLFPHCPPARPRLPQTPALCLCYLRLLLACYSAVRFSTTRRALTLTSTVLPPAPFHFRPVLPVRAPASFKSSASPTPLASKPHMAERTQDLSTPAARFFQR